MCIPGNGNWEITKNSYTSTRADGARLAPYHIPRCYIIRKRATAHTSVPRRRTFGRRWLTADFRSAAAQRGFARVFISANRGAR